MQPYELKPHLKILDTCDLHVFYVVSLFAHLINVSLTIDKVIKKCSDTVWYKTFVD